MSALIEPSQMLKLGLLSVSAMAITWLAMPTIIRIALSRNIVDIPDARKVHADPIPHLGGVVIAVAFFASCVLFLRLDPVLRAFLMGLFIIALTGLADDVWEIRPALKFAGEITASVTFVVASGCALQNFGDLLGSGPITTGRFAIPVTVFCMVGVMNAVNMADGLDGLAGGMSLIACVFFGYFAYASGNWLALGIVTALAGSLIAFLYYNLHPARVFMGDTGSLVLGYTLCAIPVMLVQPDNGAVLVAPISMSIIVGLPIVDAMLVMTQRMLKGQSPVLPDNTHLHHHLLSLNLGHAAVVRVIHIIMITCGLLAVLMSGRPEWLQFYIGNAYAALIFGTVFILRKAGLKVPMRGRRSQTACRDSGAP
jgi:UDP-GlcNAc:undecaprenyl-phosphate GlcNAc-1-phosphate transferase